MYPPPSAHSRQIRAQTTPVMPNFAIMGGAGSYAAPPASDPFADLFGPPSGAVAAGPPPSGATYFPPPTGSAAISQTDDLFGLSGSTGSSSLGGATTMGGAHSTPMTGYDPSGRPGSAATMTTAAPATIDLFGGPVTAGPSRIGVSATPPPSRSSGTGDLFGGFGAQQSGGYASATPASSAPMYGGGETPLSGGGGGFTPLAPSTLGIVGGTPVGMTSHSAPMAATDADFDDPFAAIHSPKATEDPFADAFFDDPFTSQGGSKSPPSKSKTKGKRTRAVTEWTPQPLSIDKKKKKKGRKKGRMAEDIGTPTDDSKPLSPKPDYPPPTPPTSDPSRPPSLPSIGGGRGRFATVGDFAGMATPTSPAPSKRAPKPPGETGKRKSIDVLPLLKQGLKMNKFKMAGGQAKVRKFFLNKEQTHFCWTTNLTADPTKGAAGGGGFGLFGKKSEDRAIAIGSIREIVRNQSSAVEHLTFIPVANRGLTLSIVYNNAWKPSDPTIAGGASAVSTGVGPGGVPPKAARKGSSRGRSKTFSHATPTTFKKPEIKQVNIMAYSAFHFELVCSTLERLFHDSQLPGVDISNYWELYLDFEKSLLPKHLRPQKFKWEALPEAGSGDQSSGDEDATEDAGSDLTGKPADSPDPPTKGKKKKRLSGDDSDSDGAEEAGASAGMGSAFMKEFGL